MRNERNKPGYILSCYRVVGGEHTITRLYDSVHLSYYRVIPTMRQYDSARLSYYRIVGGDNAITRLDDGLFEPPYRTEWYFTSTCTKVPAEIQVLKYIVNIL